MHRKREGKRAPFAYLLSTLIFPPCSSTIVCVNGKPKPRTSIFRDIPYRSARKIRIILLCSLHWSLCRYQIPKTLPYLPLLSSLWQHILLLACWISPALSSRLNMISLNLCSSAKIYSRAGSISFFTSHFMLLCLFFYQNYDLVYGISTYIFLIVNSIFQLQVWSYQGSCQ